MNSVAAQHPSWKRHSLCDVPVDQVTMNDLMQAFVRWSQPQSPSRYVCYVNAHVHNLARRSAEFRAILKAAAICYPDGAGVVWGARSLGLDLSNRMTGADFFPSLIRQLVARDRRVFFLGGKPGVAQRTADALATQVPGFQPVGIAHGYFDEADSPRLVAQIQAANTDLLVVGLGSPRQERWISSNLKTMSIPLTWAVGALFDYAAGEERRCPRWMGEHGLEWLFRLAVNPRRMAKRYLWGNPQFVASILGAKRSRLRSRAKSADRLSCHPSDSTVE